MYIYVYTYYIYAYIYYIYITTNTLLLRLVARSYSGFEILLAKIFKNKKQIKYFQLI